MSAWKIWRDSRRRSCRRNAGGSGGFSDEELEEIDGIEEIDEQFLALFGLPELFRRSGVILPAMHAFILAGGFATRLWPLTETRPKPLLPLADKPILTHLVEKIPEDLPITVSTNAIFAEAFEQWQLQSHIARPNGKAEQANRPSERLGRAGTSHILIEDTRHDDHKLGALGAVAQWIERERVIDDVLLLTGDNYIGFSLAEFLAAAEPGIPLLAAHDIGDLEKAKHFGTVVTSSPPSPSSTGEKGTKGGGGICAVSAFEEKPREPKTTLVSTGVSILPAQTLQILQEFAKQHPDNVGGIFEELLRRKFPVRAFVSSEPWFDIGSFDAYLAATQALVGENILRAPGGTLEESQCTGSVVIGERCRVRRSTLRNVVLFDDCVVEDCDLEDCILDEGCVLKGVDLRGKMLRKGTRLMRQ
jgi:glucose-1-phosphate thymidylyltransferase